MLFGTVSRLHGGAVSEAWKVVKTIYLEKLYVDLSWVYDGGLSNSTDSPFNFRSNILNLRPDAIPVLVVHFLKHVETGGDWLKGTNSIPSPSSTNC